MSEFQCKCERAWFYAFHSTGCPDCGATQPYYMDGMNRANVDTVVACYEDAMGARIDTAVNYHERLVEALRSARDKSHVALCHPRNRARNRCDSDCVKWTALLADIDKESAKRKSPNENL